MERKRTGTGTCDEVSPLSTSSTLPLSVSPLMEKTEGHGIPIPISSSPDSDHDEYHPPVGSPDVIRFHLSPSVRGSSLQDYQPAVPWSSESFPFQVEYYFSDENLPKDKFLLKYVTRNDGYVPIGVIASFREMKKLTRDISLIVAALKESALVVVSSNGKRVKRFHPLSLADVNIGKDPMVCTILVENLPEDHSVENLYKVFGEAGKIKNITIRDPHDAREPKNCRVTEKLISGKVTLLNNEQDWRYGLRVKLLKKVNKAGKKKFFWRESESEKCNMVQASEPSGNEENRDSSEQHDESHDEEIVDQSLRERNEMHLAEEKNGHKDQNHAPGRRQKHTMDQMDTDMERNFPAMVLNHPNLHQAQKCPMEPEGLPWAGAVPQLSIES